MVVLHLSVQGCTNLSFPRHIPISLVNTPNSSLFVEVSCNDRKRKTAQVPNGEFPQWNEVFFFSMDAGQWEEEVVRLAVKRSHRTQGVMTMGKAHIPLRHLQIGEPNLQHYELFGTCDPTRPSSIVVELILETGSLDLPSKCSSAVFEYPSFISLPTSPQASSIMRQPLMSPFPSVRSSSARSRRSVVLMSDDADSNANDELHVNRSLLPSAETSFGQVKLTLPPIGRQSSVSWRPSQPITPISQQDWLNTLPR